MTLTDPKVLKLLKNLRSYELEYRIDLYPDDERDGRDDMQMFADELSYLISCFEEYGHFLNNELRESQRVLARTKNGKEIRILDWMTHPRLEYSQTDIQCMRDTVNEYKRLKYRYKKLNEQGIYGRWY